MTALDDALRALDRGHAVQFEQRPARWKFGCLNYGDAPGLLNVADKCAWDVFAPGVRVRLPYKTRFAVKAVLGVLILVNGNHKIAVELRDVAPDRAQVRADIAAYCAGYTRSLRIPGRFRWRESLRAFR